MGEPGSGRGNFFHGPDFKTMGISFITVRGATWIGLGELFFGAGFQNVWDLLHNGGGTLPGLGIFLFGNQRFNINEG